MFLLKDENYYGLKNDKNLGTKTGLISLYAELGCLVVEPLMGLIFDTFGRKVPIIFGFLMMAVSAATVPLGRSLYPTYLLTQLGLKTGMIFGFTAPLFADYIKKES